MDSSYAYVYIASIFSPRKQLQIVIMLPNVVYNKDTLLECVNSLWLDASCCMCLRFSGPSAATFKVLLSTRFDKAFLMLLMCLIMVGPYTACSILIHSPEVEAKAYGLIQCSYRKKTGRQAGTVCTHTHTCKHTPALPSVLGLKQVGCLPKSP